MTRYQALIAVSQIGDSLENWWCNSLKALPKKYKKSESCPYDVHGMEYLERKEPQDL